MRKKKKQVKKERKVENAKKRSMKQVQKLSYSAPCFFSFTFILLLVVLLNLCIRTAQERRGIKECPHTPTHTRAHTCRKGNCETAATKVRRKASPRRKGKAPPPPSTFALPFLHSDTTLVVSREEQAELAGAAPLLPSHTHTHTHTGHRYPHTLHPLCSFFISG